MTLVADYYEVATAFPTGAGIDDRERFDPDVALISKAPSIGSPRPSRRRSSRTRRTSTSSHQGYAKSTRAIDEGYWKRWERFCKSIGASPWYY